MHTAMYSIHSNSMQSCSNHICSSTCGLSVRLSFPQISSLISSWGSCVVSCLLMVWAAELHVARLRWFRSGKHRASWGSASVLRAQAAGESRWHSDTPLLQHNHTAFTAAHTAAWVIMGNVLQLPVFTSTYQLRWRPKRAETLRTHD